MSQEAVSNLLKHARGDLELLPIFLQIKQLPELFLSIFLCFRFEGEECIDDHTEESLSWVCRGSTVDSAIVSSHLRENLIAKQVEKVRHSDPFDCRLDRERVKRQAPRLPLIRSPNFVKVVLPITPSC